jgi:hypothetical protein
VRRIAQQYLSGLIRILQEHVKHMKTYQEHLQGPICFYQTKIVAKVWLDE